MTRWLQAALATQPPSDTNDLNDKNAANRIKSFLSFVSGEGQPVFGALPVGHPDDLGRSLSPADHDLWVQFEERAAILEYDAGFSRQEAERLARLDVYGR
jgi:hypothetical protein